MPRLKGSVHSGALFSVAWRYGEYPACVFLVVGMLAIMAFIVALFWDADADAAPAAPVH